MQLLDVAYVCIPSILFFVGTRFIHTRPSSPDPVMPPPLAIHFLMSIHLGERDTSHTRAPMNHTNKNLAIRG